MSKCPHCNKELELDNPPVSNASRYGQPVLAITRCCNKGVMLLPRVIIDIAPYVGVKTEDDWGNSINPTSEETKNEMQIRGTQRE